MLCYVVQYIALLCYTLLCSYVRLRCYVIMLLSYVTLLRYYVMLLCYVTLLRYGVTLPCYVMLLHYYFNTNNDLFLNLTNRFTNLTTCHCAFLQVSYEADMKRSNETYFWLRNVNIQRISWFAETYKANIFSGDWVGCETWSPMLCTPSTKHLLQPALL